MSDDDNKVKVFASDDNLKALGELLSNETSRKIITNLMQNSMYTNEIATKLDIRVSLVIHHLKKLEELGLLEINNKKIKRKGEQHRFFKMSSDIFVTLDKSKEEIDKKGILKRIFRDGIKFTMIPLSGVVSWFSVSSTIFVEKNWKFPRDFIFSNEFLSTAVISLIVVIVSLLIYLKFKK